MFSEMEGDGLAQDEAAHRSRDLPEKHTYPFPLKMLFPV